MLTIIMLLDFIGVGAEAAMSGRPAKYIVTITAPYPTDTPAPTAIPTVETTSTDLAAALDVARGATYYSPVRGRWDAGTLLIDATQGPETDNSGIIDSGKQHIFNIEQALWKKGGFRASAIEVEVEIMVQLVDKYGHESPGVALSATLTRNTAHLFVWDNLDRDSAWGAYDTTYMLPSLQNG